MNDRLPRTECDRVLDGVKAMPSGWPSASLDPDSGRRLAATNGSQPKESQNFRSLRFQGIAIVQCRYRLCAGSG